MTQRAESEDAAKARPQQTRIPEEAGGFAILYLSPIKVAFRLK